MEGRWDVLGSAQPEHITHLPYKSTTLTFSPIPKLLDNPPQFKPHTNMKHYLGTLFYKQKQICSLHIFDLETTYWFLVVLLRKSSYDSYVTFSSLVYVPASNLSGLCALVTVI